MKKFTFIEKVLIAFITTIIFSTAYNDHRDKIRCFFDNSCKIELTLSKK